MKAPIKDFHWTAPAEVRHRKEPRYRKEEVEIGAPINAPKPLPRPLFPPALSLDGKLRRIFGEQCFYCGRTAKHFYADHLIPKSKGGSDGLLNRVLSCWDCDHKKGNRLPTADEVMRAKITHWNH